MRLRQRFRLGHSVRKVLTTMNSASQADESGVAESPTMSVNKVSAACEEMVTEQRESSRVSFISRRVAK